MIVRLCLSMLCIGVFGTGNVLALPLIHDEPVIGQAAWVQNAQSLSGDAGDERRKLFFRRHDNCKEGFDTYVNASGHSAFASTPRSRYSSSVCAWAINVGSQKAAEEQALDSCADGLQRYKVGAIDHCEIVASK